MTRHPLALVGLAAALVVLTWAVVAPATWTIFDEQAYLTQALRLAAGDPFPAAPELDGLALPGPRMLVDDAGREVPEFALGWPLFLSPLAPAGPTFAFALALVLHLLGTGAFIGVLRRLGMRESWALLYLLHPTAVLLSRSAMADVPTMAATALGLYAWLEPRRPRRGALIAGLIWGASVHLRLSQGALALALLGAALWTDHARGERRAPALLAGLAPGLVGAVLVSVWMHGALVPPTTASLSASWLLGNLPAYAIWLLLLYPGLLLTPIRRGPLRAEGGAVLVASLVLFGSFEHRYAGLEGGALVVGLRFFLPATVLLLPGYAHLLEALASGLPARWGRTLAAACGIGLVAVGIAIQARHGAVQRAQQVRVDAVAEALSGDLLLATNDARELLLEPDAPVVPWFRVPALAEHLARRDAIQVLTAARADRLDGGQEADALRSFAQARWHLEEVVHIPADGAAPEVTLWHGHRLEPL